MGELAERGVRYTLLAADRFGKAYTTKTLKSGSKLRIRTADRLGHRIAIEERFEPKVRKRIQETVRPGMTVLDIGANFGYYTVEMAHLVGPAGRVIAFEPQLRMVAELKANLEINGLDNVLVCTAALSSETGTRTFYLPAAGNEGFGSFCNNGRAEIAEVTVVPCATLDRSLSEIGIANVDFVKMDAEGAELQIVEGGLGVFAGAHRPAVVFEACEANCQPFGYCVFDLLRRFDALGFNLVQLDDSDWCAVPNPAHGSEPSRMCEPALHTRGPLQA
ncbi:MAG TPA: FkbM family methyltransferase [Bryobacteraceae bacterium]|nr:FkbM family methyltransferase [Bryobacteraceae bacterium]